MTGKMCKGQSGGSGNIPDEVDMMPGDFRGSGALVIVVFAISIGGIMVIGSVRRISMLIVMRMWHGFTHTAVGQHQTEDQKHAQDADHSPTLTERRAGNNLAATSGINPAARRLLRSR